MLADGVDGCLDLFFNLMTITYILGNKQGIQKSNLLLFQYREFAELYLFYINWCDLLVSVI